MKIDIYCASGDKKSLKLSKFLYKDAICIIMMFNLSDPSTFKNLKIYLENTSFVHLDLNLQVK